MKAPTSRNSAGPKPRVVAAGVPSRIPEVTAARIVTDGEGTPTELHILALPDQHLRGDEVYLLEVRGDSMTGEDDVLEGDYVVVDHGASWSNGDMVVVFVEGEGAPFMLWNRNKRGLQESVIGNDDQKLQEVASRLRQSTALMEKLKSLASELPKNGSALA